MIEDPKRESDIFARTVELYRERRPSSSTPAGWLDDQLWHECAQKAREEIKGTDHGT